MKVLVDTSVWSLALRRNFVGTSPEVDKLKILIREGERIFITGVILQEILQGIKKPSQLKEIRDALSYYPLLEPTKDDHIHAAELFNVCRSKGVQTSTIDALIAALAIQHECLILTSDRDFEHIAKHTALKLL